jgi:hypothetical protein
VFALTAQHDRNDAVLYPSVPNAIGVQLVAEVFRMNCAVVMANRGRMNSVFCAMATTPVNPRLLF